MIHWLAHLFGMNTGNVVSWWQDDGCCYIGFQCAKCGKVEGERMRAHINRAFKGNVPEKIAETLLSTGGDSKEKT